MDACYELSPTRLNLLRDCPRCFWFEMVKNVKRPRSPSASIVSKFDSIIKGYFNKYREMNRLPPIIDRLIEGRLAKNMPKTLYYKEGNLTLKGRPDDYLMTKNGEIVPLDHKTKSKAPEHVHPSHRLQMDVYSFLIKKNGYKTANKAFLVYYYPVESEIHEGMGMRCKVIEVETSVLKVENLLDKAREVLTLKNPPESSEGCEFCKWAGSVSKNLGVKEKYNLYKFVKS